MKTLFLAFGILTSLAQAVEEAKWMTTSTEASEANWSMRLEKTELGTYLFRETKPVVFQIGDGTAVARLGIVKLRDVSTFHDLKRDPYVYGVSLPDKTGRNGTREIVAAERFLIGNSSIDHRGCNIPVQVQVLLVDSLQLAYVRSLVPGTIDLRTCKSSWNFGSNDSTGLYVDQIPHYYQGKRRFYCTECKLPDFVAKTPGAFFRDDASLKP